jgi:hypothetical protein
MGNQTIGTSRNQSYDAKQLRIVVLHEVLLKGNGGLI